MANVLGIAGSVRAGSYNASLLRAAIALAPDGCHVQSASIRGIPLYDADLDQPGTVPEAVTALKDKLAASDALLLVTPEYNHSIPGAFKNAIDWLSRPPSEIGRLFRGRPVAMMGASTGLGGTASAQQAWLPVFQTLRMRPWFGGQLLLSNAATAFDASGNLVDDKVRARLKTFMEDFALELSKHS